MTYAIYIAAAAVIGLLIGFVAMSVDWLRKTVLRDIRSKTMGLLSVYDELLEEKSRDLRRMAQTEEQAKPADEDRGGQETEYAKPPAAAVQLPAAALSMIERAGASVYRDGSAGGLYRMIRGNFSFRVEELLPGLEPVSAGTPGPAGRLLRELAFDTVYQLSTLQADEQAEILREVLPEEAKGLLESYLKGNKRFSALAFYDSLRALADAEPKTACLRVPSEIVSERQMLGGIEIIPDHEICEGFQVEEGRLLYDYCIKARELN